ncbi:MAG: hypothetical protein DMF23_09665 [Verrucomicrobia bacterium]|nr:MAG: hypothetical protein DMF23_09665 [Verrucomicrobiota bacterium]
MPGFLAQIRARSIKRERALGILIEELDYVARCRAAERMNNRGAYVREESGRGGLITKLTYLVKVMIGPRVELFTAQSFILKLD